MNGDCGCCEGITGVVPLPIQNRPGLDALKYRIGTHATFYESLLARITTLCTGTNQECLRNPDLFKLRKALTTRDKTDPAIALFDAWAALADVLTFYQERIANEGFLRTAIERRSVQELARLVGYKLRPGVSASAWLAFDVEDPSAPGVPAAPGAPTAATSSSVEIVIPKGTAVKSTPAPGTNDQPQTFETSRELKARPEWNAINLRTSRPTSLTKDTIFDVPRLFLKGNGLRLLPNQYLAVVYDEAQPPFIARMREVFEDPVTQTTRVTLQTDELSPQALIAELRKAIDDFPAQIRAPGAETSDFSVPEEPPATVSAIHDHLASTLDTVLGSPDTRKNLLVIDDTITTAVCDLGPGTTPRAALEYYKQSYLDIAAAVQKVLDTSAIAREFRSNVNAKIAAIQREDEFLKTLAKLLPNSQDNTNKPRWIATALRVLASLTLPAADLPKLLGGFSTSPDGAPAADKPFSQLAIGDGVTAGEAAVEITLLSGDSCDFKSSADYSVTGNATHWTVAPKDGLSAPTLAGLFAAVSDMSTDKKQRVFQLTLRDDTTDIGMTMVQRTDGDPDLQLVPAISAKIAAAGSSAPLGIRLQTKSGVSRPNGSYCARFTLIPHYIKSSGDIGSIKGNIDDFTTAASQARSFVFRRQGSADAGPFADFQATFNEMAKEAGFSYSTGSFEGVLSIVVEIFDKQGDLELIPANCIAAGSIFLLVGGPNSLLFASSPPAIRELPKEIARLCNIAGKAGSQLFAEVAIPFRDGIWPDDGSATSPIVGKLRESLSNIAKDDLTNLVGVVDQFGIPDEDKDSARKRRLVECATDLAKIAERTSATSLAALREKASADTLVDDVRSGSNDGAIATMAQGDATLRKLIDEINNKIRKVTPSLGIRGVQLLLQQSKQIDALRANTSNAIVSFADAIDRGFDGLVAAIGVSLRRRWIAFGKQAAKRVKRAQSVLPQAEKQSDQAVRGWLSDLAHFVGLAENLSEAASSLVEFCEDRKTYSIKNQRSRIDRQLRGVAEPPVDSLAAR